MAVTSGQLAPFNPGFELIDGTQLNNVLAFGLGGNSFAGGLVALGTTQATALQLTAVANQMATVASGTGVALPPANAGRVCLVDTRAGANTLAIYGDQGSSDTIDGGSGSTGVTLTKAHGAAMFVCYVAGNWTSYLLGAVST